ncbi:hypothetical protein POM88_029686 [Heracleum sosnowskyi]|uniref:Uncharacterized protein n=1 Tax=Heracleum sosnowskyi TaxID=360622 RepID=A0AAD8HV68_9APIA|nr:hypothetical protein POM88_029686 [Heracleum sosnowskyi]
MGYIRAGGLVALMLIWAVAAEEQNTAKQNQGTSESWAHWTLGKLADGLELNKKIADGGAQNIVGEIGDAALKNTESVDSAASELSEFASKKADEASNLASDKATGIHRDMKKDTDTSSYAIESAKTAYATYEEKAASAQEFLYGKGSEAAEIASGMATSAKERVKDYYEKYVDKPANVIDSMCGSGTDATIKMASDMAIGAREKGKEYYERNEEKAANVHAFMYGKASERSTPASDRATKAKETLQDSLLHGEDRAFAAYNEAKSRVEETYTEAKKSMNNQAKQTYEAAKEKASEAAGTVGELLRNSGELK